MAALSAQSSHGLRPIRPAYGASRMGQGMGPQGPTISVQHLIDRHAADYRRRADLAVPLPASSAPAGQQDPQYREMLAQIAKLSKAPSAAAAAAVASVAGASSTSSSPHRPEARKRPRRASRRSGRSG